METTVGIIFLGILSGVAAQTLFIANIPYQQSPVVIPGGRVPFSNTIQNFNSAYDTVNYDFTCPDVGFYALSFMITLDEIASQSTEFRLMSSMTGNYVMKIVLPQLSNVYSSNSGTIMYFCNRNESLWVEMCPNCGGSGVVLAWDLNSFSGALMLSPAEPASFIATVPDQNSFSISAGMTVPFIYVVQSYAGNYNSQNYWFTCPVQGTYMFSFNLARNNYNIGSAEAHLMSSLSGIVMKVIQPQLGYPYSSNGGTVMYNCQASETLWVELCPNCGENTFSLSWDRNTFSGGLISVPQTIPAVSFFSTIPTNSSYNFYAGENVNFNQVWQNYGSGFSQDVFFTCPYTGLYMFSVRLARADSNPWCSEFHLLSSVTSQILLKVIVPEVNVQYGSNSGTVMYQCSAGEEIWLQYCSNCQCGTNNIMLGGDLNMFSGALMY